MTEAQPSFVAQQYGPRAADYLSSTVHAAGEDLDQIEDTVRGHVSARALDLGCGGGHVSYRVAPQVAEVIAVDVTAQMLETVRHAAADRGLRNIELRQCAAEQLPFPDSHFDFVLSRFSAHHWHDFERGLREAARVLAPRGRALFVDAVSTAAPLLDTHLQSMELLRDSSHVRNYTAAEWIAALGRAGLSVTAMRPRRLRMEFARGSRAHARRQSSSMQSAHCKTKRRGKSATTLPSRRMAVSCSTP